MKIRRALAGDLDAVVQLTTAAYAPYTALLGAPPIPVAEDYAPRIGRGEVWLLESSGEPAGLIVLRAAPGPHNDLLRRRCTCLPGQRFRHRPTQMGGRTDAPMHLPEVRLYTNAKMERNIALYKAYGFHETGRRPNPYRPGWTIVDMAKAAQTTAIA